VAEHRRDLPAARRPLGRPPAAATPAPGILTDAGTLASDDLVDPKYRLPAVCFAYVGNAADPRTWHLPYLLADGTPDLATLPKAIQAILSNNRGRTRQQHPRGRHRGRPHHPGRRRPQGRQAACHRSGVSQGVCPAPGSRRPIRLPRRGDGPVNAEGPGPLAAPYCVRGPASARGPVEAWSGYPLQFAGQRRFKWQDQMAAELRAARRADGRGTRRAGR
jgi:hypothetical protein